MQHPVFDFLGSSLVPELSSDIATSAAGNEQCVGVAVTAIWAFRRRLLIYLGAKKGWCSSPVQPAVVSPPRYPASSMK